MHLLALLAPFVLLVQAVPTSFKDYLKTPFSTQGGKGVTISLHSANDIGGQLFKRTNYVRKLQAVYFYECPKMGKARRTFQWQAAYDDSNGHLEISRGLNIHSVHDLTHSGLKFQAYWNGLLCVPVGEDNCSYLFSGKTTGYISSRGMELDLILQSTVPGDNPDVTELCQPKNIGGVDTCPAHSHPGQIRTCPIVHIAVSIPP